jgi:hypothetical protein
VKGNEVGLFSPSYFFWFDWILSMGGARPIIFPCLAHSLDERTKHGRHATNQRNRTEINDAADGRNHQISDVGPTDEPADCTETLRPFLLGIDIDVGFGIGASSCSGSQFEWFWN